MRRYTDEEMINAVAASKSIRQVLEKLGLAAAGGNYRTVHGAIDKLELDTSHFTGQGWSAGQKIGPKRDLEDYLSNKYPISSHRLRLRLIREGVFDAKCYSCNNKEWLGKPIALELEHVNGNHKDNSLGNLTLLCPNCHAQTVTYRGKNIGKAV